MGYPGGTGSLTANAFSLQLNSQFFTGSPACSGASDPSDCEAWQQFVYTYETSTTSYIFMQYWLIDYDTTCPSGWYTYSDDCYTNSNAADVSTLTASQLASLQLTASAKSGGNDGVSLSVGSGTATSVTNSDTEVDLASYWNTTEWGVYGDGGGTEAGAASCAVTAGGGTSGSAPQLGFVKTAATGSGTIEVHADTYTNGSYLRFLDGASDFTTSNAADGTFELLTPAS